jgi:hypothetical protein
MISDALLQGEIDWLLDNGVPLKALIEPDLLYTVYGQKAKDGRFEPDEEGARFLVLESNHYDTVYWQFKSGDIAVDSGRAFALSEWRIDDPWTYTFDGWLEIFPSPLEWLRQERKGIVVLDWFRAFDRLRDCPRILVPPTLLETYRKHMRPRLPKLRVAEQEAMA